MNIYEHAMLSAINAARVERGLHALAANAQLADAAGRGGCRPAATDSTLQLSRDGRRFQAKPMRLLRTR